jgi:hypothetical protein
VQQGTRGTSPSWGKRDWASSEKVHRTPYEYFSSLVVCVSHTSRNQQPKARNSTQAVQRGKLQYECTTNEKITPPAAKEQQKGREEAFAQTGLASRDCHYYRSAIL